MIKNKKFSFSFINSILLLVFLCVIAISVLFGTYLNTQKVIDKNINDYFNQTYNLTTLILENEQNNLDSTVYKISNILYSNRKLKPYSQIVDNIANFDSIDDVDILFLKTNDMNIDYSNSLFDTKSIINELSKIAINKNKSIINIKLKNKNYLLMISSKKIVDKITGRVKSVLYAGKIFNDNFTLLNKIKQKSKLKDVYIYYDDKQIASTTLIANDINEFKKNSIVVKNNIIYTNKKMPILNDKFINILYVTKNSSFEVLKTSLIKQAYVLLAFVVISFILLYFFSNKFIITPFQKLLEYAHKIKNDKNVEYKSTQVLEFDQFAYELKDIIVELRDLKEKYSRAIEGVQDGLWDVDFKNGNLFYSKRFVTMLGYDEDKKINTILFWYRHIHKDDYKITMKKLKDHISSKTDLFEHEYRFRCKDGSYKWIKIRGKIFFDENGLANKMTGFHTDINDLQILQDENSKKEQMLYQQSKLAAMGEMIGNIAHQWRQPLTIISILSSSLSMQIRLNDLKDEEAIKDLKKVVDTAKYLSSIIEKFRYFFNPDNKVEEFLIEDIIKDNLEIFESSYKSNGIELIINSDNVLIIGYKFELMQVLLNIINNAKDALVSNVKKEDDRLIFINCYEENGKTLIKIYDNAGGIEKLIKDKIYEPYFTTKHKSQGTGLGLYMSNEIIQKHFNGSLNNKTISYSYNDKVFNGEEFTIKI